MNKDQGLRGRYWFVDAFWEGNDQTDRFLEQGIWECGRDGEEYRKQVLSMRPGDWVALKVFPDKRHPLDGGEEPAMQIKATGRIAENPQDGKSLKVDWGKGYEPRNWYFFAYSRAIWQVEPTDWYRRNLIRFALFGEPQQVNRFLAEEWDEVYKPPEWEPVVTMGGRYPSYASMRHLLKVWEGTPERHRRGLESTLANIRGTNENQVHWKNPDSWIPERLTGADRKLAQAIWSESNGTVNPRYAMPSWLVCSRYSLIKPDTNGVLRVTPRGHEFLGLEGGITERHLDRAEALDVVLRLINDQQRKPGQLLPLWRSHLDEVGSRVRGKKSRTQSLSTRLSNLKTRGLVLSERGTYSATEAGRAYLGLFGDEPSPPPEGERDTPPRGETRQERSSTSYDLEGILDDGCFLPRQELERLLTLLREKKNLILQGPPGTGKTWLSQRLAFALMGEKERDRLRAVQFHPNLSYEDFVRGWRPGTGGTLELVDGTFLEFVTTATHDPKRDYAIVIEEINRGNPAQIFGELLTLLEAGKRNPESALELSYSREEKKGQLERVYVPPNLYVIGTMNTADRSLAMIDFALRRRFAFADLSPQIGTSWRKWVTEHLGVDRDTASEIERRMAALNERIRGASSLGTQFEVGHSFVTPEDPLSGGPNKNATRDWFTRVVENEIGPLLEEYWFDDSKTAEKARKDLLKDWPR